MYNENFKKYTAIKKIFSNISNLHTNFPHQSMQISGTPHQPDSEKTSICQYTVRVNVDEDLAVWLADQMWVLKQLTCKIILWTIYMIQHDTLCLYLTQINSIVSSFKLPSVTMLGYFILISLSCVDQCSLSSIIFCVTIVSDVNRVLQDDVAHHFG